MEFGWDEGKRQWLLEDREIDFVGMQQLFDGRPRLTSPSPRDDEDRRISIGEVNGKLYAVVWMWREDMIWMITARRARKTEEKRYYELLRKRKFDERQD